MISSLSDSTIIQYEVTYKLWWNFCRDRNICPFNVESEPVISFLQNILDSTNNLFGSVNSHRSALSLISLSNLGDDLSLKRFLKGVFKLRPPKPKYNYTWNPEKVIRYFDKSDDSSLTYLSHKLVTLLTLVTGHRLQTIALIRCSNINITDECINIFIPDLIKTSKPNSYQPNLRLPFFKENKNICVASCLLSYLNHTESHRRITNEDHLFLTCSKPLKPATKQTLSRWVKTTLYKAGVDTKIFQAHSTRHAATSAALRSGVSLDVIRRTAGWTQSSQTFAKFYNRPLMENNNFAECILSQGTTSINSQL